MTLISDAPTRGPCTCIVATRDRFRLPLDQRFTTVLRSKNPTESVFSLLSFCLVLQIWCYEFHAPSSVAASEYLVARIVVTSGPNIYALDIWVCYTPHFHVCIIYG